MNTINSGSRRNSTDRIRLQVNERYISVADIDKPKESHNNTPTAKETKPQGTSSTPKFNRNSRNALLKTLYSLTEPPQFFVTLNFPEKIKRDPRAWMTQFSNLRRRLVHEFPSCWFIWRLEPHRQSGRPHFHLVGSLGKENTEGDFWSWISNHWCRITKTPQSEAQFSTNVQKVKPDADPLFRYMAQEEDDTHYHDFYGSWTKVKHRWKVFGRKNAPMRQSTEYVITRGDYKEIKDAILGSIQAQINDLEAQLTAATPATSRRTVFILEESLKRKKAYKGRVERMDDYFGILDNEHVDLIRTMLDEAVAIKP